MKLRISATILVAILSSTTLSADTRTFTGSYIAGDSEYPDRGNLRAVFSPTGEGVWDVVFDFDFQGEDYTFTGIAEGSLDAGLRFGTVQNESGHRTFVFRGEFTDGVFHGTHAEMEHGGETPTGTMLLQEIREATEDSKRTERVRS